MVNIGKHRTEFKGYKSLSKTFSTKREAQTWSYTIESELKRGLYIDHTLAENILVNDILKRYETNVVSRLRSEKRIKASNLFAKLNN